MVLSEPLTLLIGKDRPFVLFKTKDGDYLLFNGVQTVTMSGVYESILNNYYIITEEKDIIPFIIVHNWRIDAAINDIKNTKGGRVSGRTGIIQILNNARIDNVINTDLTIDDIYKEYDNGIITYDELHIFLTLYTRSKYENIYRRE